MKLREDREKLISLLPDFLKQILEIRLIQQIADGQIELINEAGGKAVDSAFIEDADEEAVARYESIFGIANDQDMTLEDRRKRLMVKTGEPDAITHDYLEKNLSVICDDEGFAIKSDDENNHLDFTTHVEGYNMLRYIEDWLDDVLPVSIYYTLSNGVTATSDSPLAFAGGVYESEVIYNSDAYDMAIAQSMAFGVSGEEYDNDVIYNSDAYDDTVTNAATFYVGGAGNIDIKEDL